ncbi:hypothetical protein G7054_g2838 [Neopestalotiopsis clavispora]|nr:hypothetical protein E8E14_010870 [Neopestalotiopsis sp. 37M]KAF7538604.1 hypothetical protein G7054_g2838 [Neopestalotiopsis clavispora]
MNITGLLLAILYSGVLGLPTIPPSESSLNDNQTIATCESCSAPDHDDSPPSTDITDKPIEWTLRELQRKCYKEDKICIWKFGIDCSNNHLTKCYFVVNSTGGNKTAKETDSLTHLCGRFTVSSGWSSQFGPGRGFSVLALVDTQSELIAWPSYSDKQLQNGTAVTPDQKYIPKKLTDVFKGADVQSDGGVVDEEGAWEEEEKSAPVQSGGW